MDFREKTHRLAAEYYVGKMAVAFTACERLRRPLFANAFTFDAFCICLRKVCSEGPFVAPILTVMPDHVHLLLIGTDDSANVKDAMVRFKRLTGQWLSSNSEARWQKDFYDHIIRYHEGPANYTKYIALNPVRAGLCADPLDYPFTASVGCDLKEVLEEAWWNTN